MLIGFRMLSFLVVSLFLHREFLLLTATMNAQPWLTVALLTGLAVAGLFRDGQSYASCGAVENVIAVAARIPGCPPTPLALITVLRTALRYCAPAPILTHSERA